MGTLSCFMCFSFTVGIGQLFIRPRSAYILLTKMLRLNVRYMFNIYQILPSPWRYCDAIRYPFSEDATCKTDVTDAPDHLSVSILALTYFMNVARTAVGNAAGFCGRRQPVLCYKGKTNIWITISHSIWHSALGANFFECSVYLIPSGECAPECFLCIHYACFMSTFTACNYAASIRVHTFGAHIVSAGHVDTYKLSSAHVCRASSSSRITTESDLRISAARTR